MSNRYPQPSGAAAVSSVEHEGASTPEVERRAKLMLVSNDLRIWPTLEEPLRNAGHDVEPVDEGRVALKALRANKPDLLILDLALPDVPGTEVCRSLRGERSTRG